VLFWVLAFEKGVQNFSQKAALSLFGAKDLTVW